MKYKQNQKVKLKPFRQEFDSTLVGTNSEMELLFGTIVTISHVNVDTFIIKEDEGNWTWLIEWIVEPPKITLPDELFTL